tara:strand:+ start:22 stop:234 length:213 start_codon:yes stop_codon:yes gene_type:complete
MRILAQAAILQNNYIFLSPGVARRYIKKISPIIGINKSKVSNRLLPMSFNLLQAFAIFIIKRIIISMGIN